MYWPNAVFPLEKSQHFKDRPIPLDICDLTSKQNYQTQHNDFLFANNLLIIMEASTGKQLIPSAAALPFLSPNSEKQF